MPHMKSYVRAKQSSTLPGASQIAYCLLTSSNFSKAAHCKLEVSPLGTMCRLVSRCQADISVSAIQQPFCVPACR